MLRTHLPLPEGVPKFGLVFHEHLEILMRRGAELDAVNHLGETAVFLAAEDGHVSAIRTLVAAGADMEQLEAVLMLLVRVITSNDSWHHM